MLVAILLGHAIVAAGAELAQPFQGWNRPVEPFLIADNLYYVGSNELAAYLFATPAGHVLLDGGFEQTAPLIRSSIEALGFSLADVKVLINSHAHSDHAGGLALIREWSGAALVASRGDKPLLEAGGEEPYPFPPVVVDRVIDDGDTVELGGTMLTARITPGHTPGCTTWTTGLDTGGGMRAALFICSVNALPEMNLLSPDPDYPQGRVAAFEHTFDLLDELPCEVFLGSHASFFLMLDKRQRLGTSADNPFIDPALCRRHIASKRQRFHQELARQRAGR